MSPGLGDISAIFAPQKAAFVTEAESPAAFDTLRRSSNQAANARLPVSKAKVGPCPDQGGNRSRRPAGPAG